MRPLLTSLVVVFFCCLLCGWTQAEQLPSFEAAAEKLQAATVTIRVTSSKTSDEPLAKRSPEVSVFTGVSLGDGLIVSPLFVADKATVRVTIPGGDQARAVPLVLDEPSGLALLQLDKRDVPKLELSEQVPNVGAWVISAAGWGVEKPVVSFGMVSGIDRRLPGSTYPPLLQCNMTSTETSSGAGVVDHKGQLVGIIVATDAKEKGSGWIYAVPVNHIQRFLRVHADQKPPADAVKEDGVLIIPRRRPIVGMEIGGQLDEVFVQRVTKGGPADRAGIKAGDQIVAVDGVKIRSPYQAVSPTLFKQPGDHVTFLVQQADAVRPIEVVLGGGVAVPADDGQKLSHLIQPKIMVDNIALRDSIRRLGGQFGEVFGDDAKADADAPDKLAILEKAVEGYQTVIKIQQERLSNQQQELDESIKMIQSLQAQIDALKKDRAEPRNPPAR